MHNDHDEDVTIRNRLEQASQKDAMGYTKGEWELINPMNDEWIVKAHDGLIAVVSRNSLITSMTNKANAHLLAAAPRMYEALRHTVIALVNKLDDTDYLTQQEELLLIEAREALSKADGGK